MAERFTGFPLESIEFFEDLEMNNNRDWFQANKPVYERTCRGPMEALIAELEPSFGPAKIFRINRDIRFSADKSPYKTYIAAHLRGGYISLSPNGLYVGGGGYMLSGSALDSYRRAVAADKSGAELSRIVGALEKKRYEVGSYQQLRSAPKGYPKDHPRIRFLQHKGLHSGRSFEIGKWLATRKAIERVKTVLTDLKPLNSWFAKHVEGM